MKVVVSLYYKPHVFKSGAKVGDLCEDVLNEFDQKNQKWWKTHRLALSTPDSLMYLNRDRSLVRYSWQDIEKGIFDHHTCFFKLVADFVVKDDVLTVLQQDGHLTVQGRWSTTTLKALVEVARWTCLQKARRRWLCAGVTCDQGGIVALLPPDGNKVTSSLKFALRRI